MTLWERALAAVGVRRSHAPLALAAGGIRPGSRVVADLSLWQQFSRVGGGLTPTDVSMIIRQADSGDMAALVELAQESRQKDGHLQGCLEQCEESIASLEWSLILPDGAKAGERRAALFVERVLRECDDMQRLVAHLTGAVYLGYAVSEIVWAVEGGRLVPSKLVNLDQRRFGFRSGDGTFVWKDTGTGDGVDFRAAYPNKFITCQPRVTGDVPCREGLARVLVWAALFRNWTLIDWLRLGEIAWKPWRIGKYQKGAAKEDIDGLVDVLDGMSASGVARIPETIDIDVKWAPGATTKPMHEALYETVAREMSKAILGQTETVQSSDTSGYAQASVLNDVRKELRDARAKQIATDLTRDLIRPLVALNFGPNVRPPRLTFNTQDAVDLDRFAAGIEKLARAGVVIPQAYVRDEAGIPEPKGDEPVIGAQPEPEPESAPESSPDVEGDEPDDDEAADEP